jgi:serine/threonine protein kinase
LTNGSSKKAGHKPSLASGIVKEVALKVIPKKKVKESEANVWGEMEVLKGLDHPNIVKHLGLRFHPDLIFPIRSNSTNGLNPGQNITSHSNLRLAVNSLREF